jgi:hypothetical protein
MFRWRWWGGEDGDDGRSICTAVPHELESVEDDDEEDEAERRR